MYYQVLSDLIKGKTTPKCSVCTYRVTDGTKFKIFLVVLDRPRFLDFNDK